MRIPLPVQFKTRKGDVTKDARIKNGYVEILGEVGRVRKRPGNTDLGLIEAGAAQLLSCWNGLLSVVGDSLFVALYSAYVEYDFGAADVWDINASYSAGSWVWYNGDLWYAELGGAAGTVPSAANGWWYNHFTGDTYDNDTPYEIGDQITYRGILYFAYADMTGLPPISNPDVWGITSPPITRYHASYAGVPGFTPEGATIDAAAAVGFPQFYATVSHACPGDYVGSPVWYTSDYIVSGNVVYGSQYGTAGTRACGDPINGPYPVAVATVTVV